MDEKRLKEKALMHDKEWDHIMKLAKQHGFIIQAYGGSAVLGTHETQLELGKEKYQEIQKMNGLPDNSLKVERV